MSWKPFTLSLLLSLVAIAGAPAVEFEVQNGLQVAVTPKTISRNDARYASLFATERAINRMMALQIIAKNVSTKTMEEGTVEWKILVLPTGGGATLYTGTTQLPKLKTATSKELLVGSAQVMGWRDASYQRKDKLEFKVTISHGGTPTTEVVSTPAFDQLASTATRAQQPDPFQE